jgi:hypothetical protein
MLAWPYWYRNFRNRYADSSGNISYLENNFHLLYNFCFYKKYRTSSGSFGHSPFSIDLRFDFDLCLLLQ